MRTTKLRLYNENFQSVRPTDKLYAYFQTQTRRPEEPPLNASSAGIGLGTRPFKRDHVARTYILHVKYYSKLFCATYVFQSFVLPIVFFISVLFHKYTYVIYKSTTETSTNRNGDCWKSSCIHFSVTKKLRCCFEGVHEWKSKMEKARS